MLEQELNRYWKTVVNTIQDGVMIVDTDGTIVSANKALEKITGYPKKELIGKPCTILNCNICEIARERKGEKWCSLFKTGALSMRKCALMKKNGGHIHVLKNASLLHDTDGIVIGAVETMTDISELIKKDTQIEAFRRELRTEDGFHGILGASAPMQQIFDLINNISESNAPVIIFGESGTGKELVAKAIHDTGTRRQKPYVKVNCAALTESLLESELFGHVKGAFTGAYRSREGRFEAAHGGDIFLDEIGDLPLSTQVKMLRVLEEKVVERVGDNRPIHTDVRIISATNRNLKQLVDQGGFREDLFYRINVIPIMVPPLRERVGDIPLLAEHFFRRIKLKNNHQIESISNESMLLLMRYTWPGNVRELKSAFEYAFVTCQESMIQPYHLPPALHQTQPLVNKHKKAIISRNQMKEKELMEVLERTGGNQSRAAEILGISRVTVWNRMKRYGITAQKKYSR
ncbi:MAG: sigma 54-interacting transcriptional regulator [Desulfobacteraceae bacterium]|jgi:PAS domain S-box-containing protein|nr:sigma 54-interacting transcriptional regulator [Desulfobacteraceae bacterium]